MTVARRGRGGGRRGSMVGLNNGMGDAEQRVLARWPDGNDGGDFGLSAAARVSGRLERQEPLRLHVRRLEHSGATPRTASLGKWVFDWDHYF